MPGIEMMRTLQLFLEADKGRSKSSWVLSDPEGRDLAQRFDFTASSPASPGLKTSSREARRCAAAGEQEPNRTKLASCPCIR